MISGSQSNRFSIGAGSQCRSEGLQPVRKWSAQTAVKATAIQKTIVKSCAPIAFIVIHPPRGKEAQPGPFIRQEFNVTPAAGRQEGEEGAFLILSELIFRSTVSKTAPGAPLKSGFCLARSQRRLPAIGLPHAVPDQRRRHDSGSDVEATHKSYSAKPLEFRAATVSPSYYGALPSQGEGNRTAIR